MWRSRNIETQAINAVNAPPRARQELLYQLHKNRGDSPCAGTHLEELQRSAAKRRWNASFTSSGYFTDTQLQD